MSRKKGPHGPKKLKRARPAESRLPPGPPGSSPANPASPPLARLDREHPEEPVSANGGRGAPFCSRGPLVSESVVFVRGDQTPGPRNDTMPPTPQGRSHGSRPRPDFHNAPASRYTGFHRSGARSSSHHEPCSTAGGISRDDKHNDSATFRRRIRHCVPYIRTISSPEDIPSGPQRARSLERDGRRSRLRSHA